MNVSQLSAKILGTGTINQVALIPIFHKWIREKRLGDDKVLIDVADYRHVPDGPGIMIVADHAHYGLDEMIQGQGLIFNRKRDAAGPVAEKLNEALTEVLAAAAALQAEPTMAGKANFGSGKLVIQVFSRLHATNGQDDFLTFSEAAAPVLDKVFPDGYTIHAHGRASDPLTLYIEAESDTSDPATLLARL